MHNIYCSTDECCYWYRRFPATPSVCHGTNQTSTVTLICEIEYQPPQNNSHDIEVKWYRSRSEEYAGREGDSLIDQNKYIRHPDRDLTPMNQPFIMIWQYILGINNFNSSDRGYYWCQIMINNVSLSPSPYGYIYRSQCTFLDITCTVDQPVCAQNLNQRFMAHTHHNSFNCSLEGVYAIGPSRTVSSEQNGNTASTLVYKTSENTDKISVSILSPTVNMEGSRCDLSNGGHLCAIIGIVASGLLVLILLLLIVMVLCLCYHKNKSKHSYYY